MLLKKAQHSRNRKKSNGRRALGCMTRWVRRFHWALLAQPGTVVGSLWSCSPGWSPNNCGMPLVEKIYPSVCHSWQIYILIFGVEEGSTWLKYQKVKWEESPFAVWLGKLFSNFTELYNSWVETSLDLWSCGPGLIPSPGSKVFKSVFLSYEPHCWIPHNTIPLVWSIVSTHLAKHLQGCDLWAGFIRI